jgi:hypothetical protein
LRAVTYAGSGSAGAAQCLVCTCALLLSPSGVRLLQHFGSLLEYSSKKQKIVIIKFTNKRKFFGISNNLWLFVLI